MLTLIYGSDSLKCYSVLDVYKERGYENFFGNNSDLFNLISSIALFTSQKKFIINLEINTAIKLDSTFEKLLIKNKDLDLVIYLPETQVKSSILKIFDNLEKFLIEDNKEIFKYLDAVYTKNIKNVLLYTQKYTDQEVYIISMLFYSLKNLLLFYYNNNEFKKLNSYVQQKTVSYSKNSFSKEKCKNLLYALSEADYKIKTGSDAQSVLFSLLMYMLN